MAIIASASTYIRSEDVEYKRSVSENILTKVGASINYILDNALLSDPALTKQVFTSSGTFTVPAGITAVKVTLVAGGAAGGSSSGANAAGGGGGGGYSQKFISGLTPASNITVTIGAGGAPSASSTGGAGGTTSFGAHCSATGGSGGLATGPQGGSAGAGSSGDVNLTGKVGMGIQGGDSHLGFGAYYIPAIDESGVAGSVYGAGGSGSGEKSTGTPLGGAGSAGFVIVEWIA